jgi:16S rRNA G1207 methylase RsmC
LSLALSGYKPQAMSDSYLSQAATQLNLALNAQAATAVTLIDSLTTPEAPLDVVLIKVPKTMAWLNSPAAQQDLFAPHRNRSDHIARVEVMHCRAAIADMTFTRVVRRNAHGNCRSALRAILHRKGFHD